MMCGVCRELEEIHVICFEIASKRLTMVDVSLPVAPDPLSVLPESLKRFNVI